LPKVSNSRKRTHDHQSHHRPRADYDAIVDYIDSHGYAPTVRELCGLLDIASPNGVECHLKTLERRGWIVRTERQARTIRPIGGER
jgi:repressor LexA